MAATNEHRLVSALVRSGNLNECTERGMIPAWLEDGSDHKMVYEFCVGHTTKYGKFPSPTTVKDNFPAYSLLKTTDPLDYFVDQLVAFRREELARQAALDMVKRLESKEPEDAIKVTQDLQTTLREFSPVPVYQTDLTKTTIDRWDAYLERKKKGSSMIGLESGYPTIDEATLGFQPEQLIVLVASSKTGKSTVCLRICQHIHEKYDKVPLFVSFEMTRRELADRHDATRSKVPLSTFLSGNLKPSEETNFMDMLDDMEDKAKFVLADSSEGTTIDSIHSRVQDVKPDILVVDGVYLMRDQTTGESGTPLALTNLTRGMKRLAQTLKIPIIISTQALRTKMARGGMQIGADSAGYSSSFSQDADVLLGLEEVKDAPEQRILRVVMSRNSGPAEVGIDFSYERGEFGELSL